MWQEDEPSPSCNANENPSRSETGENFNLLVYNVRASEQPVIASQTPVSEAS